MSVNISDLKIICDNGYMNNKGLMDIETNRVLLSLNYKKIEFSALTISDRYVKITDDNDLVGIYDCQTETVVITCMYSDISYYKDENVFVAKKTSGKYTIISGTNYMEVLDTGVTPIIQEFTFYNSDKAVFLGGSGKFGVINKEGTVIVPAEMDPHYIKQSRLV